MNKILCTCLSLLLLASVVDAKAKAKKVKAEPNPRLGMTLDGGLGIKFGLPEDQNIEQLKVRGFTNKLDSVPNCTELDYICKAKFTTVLVADSIGQKSINTNPLDLDGQGIQILTMQYGAGGRLTAFNIQSDFAQGSDAVKFHKAVQAKIESKYGKGSCEVKSETVKDLCEVMTWDFGVDGAAGSIQQSLAGNSFQISYKSAQAVADILSQGQKLVAKQSSAELTPASQGTATSTAITPPSQTTPINKPKVNNDF